MKITDLKDRSVIVLQRNVHNPKPDMRRNRYNLAYVPTWAQGQRLLVKFNDGRACLHFDEGYAYVDQNDAGFMQLVDAAEPSERNLRDMLWAAIESNAVTRATDVLESLVLLGKLTLDDVQAGIDHNYAKEMARTDEEAA